MTKVIYYLPGAGGRLDAGLGQGLLGRGFSIVGRESDGAFQRLRFDERVRLVADDLQTDFWRDDALVVANSFGAYLFLHAQAGLPPYPGKVLLLSPIVGEAAAPGGGPHFVPPFSTRLLELAQAGQMPVPQRCEVHVGSEDWQSDTVAVTRLGSLLGIPITVVPGAGHMLGQDYVGGVLVSWLPPML